MRGKGRRGLESSKDILGFCQVKSIISVANSGGSPNKKAGDAFGHFSDILRVRMHPLMCLCDALVWCIRDMCDIWAGADAPKYWCTYYPNYNMCDITEKPDIGQIWPKNYALQLICPKLKGKSWHQAGFDQLMLSRVGYLFPNPISTGLNLNFNERHLIFRFRMSGDRGLDLWTLLTN